VKVLVVEDDAAKAANILEVLKSKGVVQADIDVAADGRSARIAMRSDRYDLAIVDLVLPFRSGELPQRLGGLELVREVRTRGGYAVPLQFMALSAFDDVVDESGGELADEVLLVLRYEEASAVWRDRLGRLIDHLNGVIALSTSTRPLRADICVVTAVRSPELSAVLDLPWGWEELEVLGDGTLYYRGRADAAGGGHLSVVAACCARMGMVASAVLTSKMCVHFRPRFVAMCGILAAVDRDLGMGDVVVADPTWNYESGKRAPKENEEASEFLAAPDHLALDPWLRERLAALSADSEMLDDIRRGFGGATPANALAMHVGPVASGSSVVGAADYLRDARSQHRKLVGIEMETYGVFAAVQEAQQPRPNAVSVKSVSDYADSEKSDEFQRYAAYTSASVLRLFVEKYLRTEEPV
jgi:nucleoside phosphorylase